MITKPGGDPRQVFMQTERIATPKSTRPFVFRRAGKYKHEWYCSPLPGYTHCDDEGREWPMYKFCLTYDRQLGWCAGLEGCIVMMNGRFREPGEYPPIEHAILTRLLDYGDYDEICAEWFKDLPEAIAYLRKQLDWCKKMAEGDSAV